PPSGPCLLRSDDSIQPRDLGRHCTPQRLVAPHRAHPGTVPESFRDTSNQFECCVPDLATNSAGRSPSVALVHAFPSRWPTLCPPSASLALNRSHRLGPYSTD